ncbi:unnamed protein product, partial [Rotaria sordida]
MITSNARDLYYELRDDFKKH